MDLREWYPCVPEHKNMLTLSKRHFFIEEYIEDVKQDEKHILDLMEAMMRPPDPVREELRLILFKIAQFGSKIQTSRFSTFWIPEIRSFPAGGQSQPAR